MRLSILALLLTFLVSCESLEQKLVCKQIPSFEVVTVCNVSFEYDACYCGEYDYQRQKLLTGMVAYPLEHCNNLVGYPAQDYSEELKPKIIKLNNLHDDLCN